MKATRILKAFATAGKRVQLVGDLDAGVIIALDMEGRLFTVLEGEVLNRVNPDAIAGESTREALPQSRRRRALARARGHVARIPVFHGRLEGDTRVACRALPGYPKPRNAAPRSSPKWI